MQAYLQEAGRLELHELGPDAKPRRPPGPEALLRLRNAANKARDSHRRMGVACMALLCFIILILGASLVQGLIAGHLASGLVGGTALALLLVQDRMRQLPPRSPFDSSRRRFAGSSTVGGSPVARGGAVFGGVFGYPPASAGDHAGSAKPRTSTVE